MNKDKRITVLVLSILIVLLVGLLLAVSHLIYFEGRFYPKAAQAMDLREEALTVEDYRALSAKMPGCYILWSIPFQGGSLASNTDSVTVTSLTEEDVLLLDYAANLQTVDATGCADYAQLDALQQRHPNTKILYRMTISGVKCDQDTTELTLEGLTQDDAQLLSYLPKLSKVSISGCDDYSLLMQLQQDNPQWNLRYTVALGDEEFDWDSETIQARNATCDQLTAALAALPQIKELDLINPKGDGQVLVDLRNTYSDVKMHWQVELYGQTATEETTELDISGTQVASCEEVEQAVSCLPNLQTLVMSDCGIDSQTMSDFRERQRGNYKVVWTVYLGDICKLRTDAKSFMPIKQGEWYFLDSKSEELKYCEEMEAMDLGHHAIHNIDFVAYMPHLKYLVLAHTQMKDISPIANCKELVFLELDWSIVEDYTPLLECTALEDLNLGKLWGSAEPITKMTWLKNLWWLEAGYSKQVALQEALPDTKLMFNSGRTVGAGWRNLPNYYAMRDALGAEYMT